MDDNKKFWQRVAPLYSPFMEKGSKQLYEQISDEISYRLNQNMKVLELACGSGQLSFRLAEYTKSWTATDFSENMIFEAKKQPHLGNLLFAVQDATELPYESNSFDAVLIANALHIMPNPDRALAEIHRVLNPDGILFAPTFVHGKGAGFRFRSHLLELGGFKVYSKWTADEFAAYVLDRGFSLIDVKLLGKSLAPLCYLLGKKRLYHNFL